VALISRVARLFREIFVDEMPLQEFASYDEYWDTRKCEAGPIHPRYALVAARLPETGSVVDIGCGDGRFLRHLKATKPALRICGVDGSASAIDAVRAADIEGEVVDVARDSLAHLASRAEYVTVMELIEHIENAEDVMRKVHQLGAKRVFVTIPNVGFIGYRLRLALGGRMPLTTCLFHVREHVRFWTVRDFKYWAGHLGFRVLAYYGQGDRARLRWAPSLLARQIIYELETVKPTTTAAPAPSGR
jgi:methionine biosynthesis protein MetW